MKRAGFAVVLAATIMVLGVACESTGGGEAAPTSSPSSEASSPRSGSPAPTTSPKPRPSPTPTPSYKPPPAPKCHSSYTGVCLKPDASDYDCAGGSGNGPYYVEGPFRVVGPDVYGLDGNDNDGIACE